MRRWFRWVEQYVRKHHGIYSLGGRWCDLAPEMESGEEWMQKRAFRRGYNFPFQATGAEIIGDAMVRVMRDEEFRELGYRVCLQVHDELVCRGPIENLQRAEELLRLHMTSATANGTPLLFPIAVSSGSGANYWEAK
jgi:DNA polymerase I-like protein with 3'-5' exonuclease and polymerase domains